MSGIFNLVLASFGSGVSPVGLLASISNPTNADLEGPRITIRDDQLNLSINTNDGTPTIRKLITAQLSLDLEFIWQRSLSNDVNYPLANTVAIDSFGNVIAVGQIYDSSAAISRPYIVKFNNSGTIQWQQQLNIRATYNGIAVDPSDNIYTVGFTEQFGTGLYDIYVVKCSSSGTQQYSRYLGTGGSPNELAYSVAIPNNTLFAVAGEAEMANLDATLWFLNQSDGTTSGATNQRDAAGAAAQRGVAVIKGETDGVLYYAVNGFNSTSVASPIYLALLKWTSSGGFVWQRNFQPATGFSLSNRCLAMSSDNSAFYAVGTISSLADIQITKWGIDGSLIWQRSISSTGANLSDASISVDSLDNIYVCFRSYAAVLGGIRTMVLKMPGSGAGSGQSVILEGIQYFYTTTAVTPTTTAFSIDTQTRGNGPTAASTGTPSATSVTGTLALTSAAI